MSLLTPLTPAQTAVEEAKAFHIKDISIASS